MNWLYTIIISGLIFASGEDVLEPAATGDGRLQPAEVAQDVHREKIERSYPLNSNGRVRVSNINGSITVESWDRNEVQLEAVKIADSKEALDAIEIKIDSRADLFSASVDVNRLRRTMGDGSWKNFGRGEVQFKLSVPRTASLDDIETVNGSVTVSGFTNTTKVSTVNGNVSALNLRGSASLETVNGEVKAEFDQLDPMGRISLEAVNGRASLVIPSDANATVKADTLNGTITNDLGLMVRKGKYVGRDLHGRLGGGETQIKLSTVNGQLSILRRNDGRPPSPVTNLFQEGSNSEDDLQRGLAESKRSAEKARKDIERSVKEAARVSAEAGIKIAQDEVARILPEIDKISLEGLDKVPAVDVGEITKKVADAVAGQTDALTRLSMISWGGGSPYMETRSNSFSVKNAPKITVEAKGCAVRVRGWDKQEVAYKLTEVSRSDVRVAPTIEEAATDSSVELNVRAGGPRSRDAFLGVDPGSARIEIFVPKRSDLKIDSNREIRIEGVSGNVELIGMDEAIDVRNGEGRLTISSAEGQVRVIGHSGDLESTTEAGNVFLEGSFSSIRGRSNDGNFIVTLPEAANADIRSNADSISLDGLRDVEVVSEGHWRLGRGGSRFDFDVSGGSVRIRSLLTISGTK